MSNPTMAKAKMERPSGSICFPREPAISLEKAINIAKKYNPSSAKSFIDIVTLECKAKIASWKVGFRLKEYKSGHFVVTIYMDGTTKITITKDG